MINESFCSPATWFDGFFSSPRVDREVRAGSRLRWQNDYYRIEGGRYNFGSKLRGSLKLPRASKRLRLVFEGEKDEPTERVVALAESNETEIGLLYRIKKTRRSRLNLKVSLSPAVTLRYRYLLPLSTSLSFGFTEEFFRRDNAYGASSLFEFVKNLDDGLVLRQSNLFTRTENFEGTNWGIGLTLFQQLNNRQALSYESSYAGVTHPSTFATSTRVGIRYRENFYRDWLFYEIAPEITWPRAMISDRREKIWAILFRLEMNFVNL